MKSLGTRFLWPLGTIAVLFAFFGLYRNYSASQDHTIALIQQQANLAMQFDLAIREYTGEKIRPVMERFLDKDGFMPETMSTSYISRSIFEKVRKQFPEYIIRFASDNPRNPINAATPDELRLIHFFRENRHVSQRSEIVTLNGRKYWAHFVPKWIKEDCMRCHGDPKDAPAELIKRYGSTASFHRAVGDVAGLDTIAIPLDTINAELSSDFKRQSIISITGIVLLCVSILLIFRFVVTKRLTAMAAHFQKIAEHPESHWMTPLAVRGRDEISVLGHAFNRLAAQLRAAHESLEQRVQERTADLEQSNTALQKEAEDRLNAEEALRASETRLKSLFHAAPIGLTIVEGRIHRMANKRHCEITGYSEEELFGQSTRILYETDAEFERVGQALYANLAEQGQTFVETVFRRKDGELRNVIVSAAFLDPDAPSGPVVVAIQDITENKKAEAALQSIDAYQRLIIRHAPFGMHFYRLEPDGQLIFEGGNPAADTILGLDHHALEGKIIEEAFPGLQKTSVPDIYKQIARNGGIHHQDDMNYDEANGLSGAYEFHAFQTMPNRMAVFFADITARKQAEMELRKSEERYRQIVDTAQEGIWCMDENFVTSYVNPQTAKMLGYDPGELMGRPFLDFIHEEDVPDQLNLFERRQQGLQDRYERRLRTKNGREFWGVLSVAPVFDEQRKFAGSFAMLSDITDRKRMEEELRTSETTLQTLLQAAPIGITITQNRIFQYVNDRYCNIVGYSREELIGHSSRMLYDSGEDFTRVGRELFDRLKEHSTSSFETYHRRKDGSPIDILLSAAPLEPTVSKVVVTVMDITEHKHTEAERQRLETQFQQAQKMEAVGQLAGGVAHDFNNLLQVINGYTDIALMDLEPGSPATQALQEIATAGERAARLIGQLLAFSRRQIMKLEYMSLNTVVEEFLKMVKRVIGEDIHVNFVPGPALGVVHVDRGQMEQVIMNLCVNARDAMPQGGTLTIETKNVVLDHDYCEAHAGAAPGHYILLTLTDTGCGMDTETQKHIFEPFFTTKGLGKGTGLGLATVYGIIKQHDGMIQVYSEPGMGTIFKIYLPKLEPSVHQTLPKDESPVRGGHETILMAEDDPMVRALAQKVLENAGYTVLAACDGREALQVFYENPDRVDLVLLDVVMPNLGGKAVYDELRRDFPTLRFLFASGYSENAIHTGFILDEGIQLIQKPYAPKELLRRIRMILDNTR